ncbi:hypothetical protein MHBO_002671 [Bonamia ostreae]|uniref:Uncharacterized protein n=1 Tax=Bonamia ostreae TaxID=126728 RepID=A0ABV2ANV9_9EUKA
MPCTVPATIPKKKEMRRIESFGNLSSLMSASDVGDTDGIRDLVAESADLMLKNYDKRTALHLAAAKDHVEVIELLVNRYNGQKRHWKELSQTDRWGLTPLDLAYRKKALRSIEILEKCGAKRGSELKKNGEVLDKNDLNLIIFISSD